MRRYIGPTLLWVSLTLVACGGAATGPGESASEFVPAEHQLAFDPSGWQTDFSKHSVPLTEFTSGGPGRDGIPPIDEPTYASLEEAGGFLSDREPVIVVEEGSEVRGYPLQILVWHEIVNDHLGGRPIAVTYCPLCNSSVVFDRRVDERELTFGTTGNLRNSDLVMWDRQTESWWQQLTAEAVVGELTGARLEVLPSQVLSFADFRERFPEADVLSQDTGFNRDYGTTPYTAYDNVPEEQPFLLDEEADSRLPPKARVTALFVRKDTLVIPFTRLQEEPVVDEEVARTPVVVFFDPDVASVLDETSIASSDDVGTAAAFERRLGGRTLTFEGDHEGFFDEQTGSEWDITGRAVAGPLAGKRLKPVRHDEQFWFALAAFVPDARIIR